ncbi:MAG: L,D-transpeptidase family protein, partial [Ilumatobacteraceae bacterium]
MSIARHQSRNSSQWLPGVAAVTLLGAVVAAGVAGGFTSGGDDPESSSIGTPAASPSQDSVAPVATVAIKTVPKERKRKLSETLSYGMNGDEVMRVQKRLKQLEFDPGPVDGVFGELTRVAVWGFEKLIMGVDRSEATGLVTPRMWNRMQDDIEVEPRRPNSTPTHTEVYLPEQILILFENDRPTLITHMSSGDGMEWCEEVTISAGEYGNEDGTEPLVRGECGQSLTPGGVYSYDRQIEGLRQSALGGMWNPVYFNYGIAIHGAINVPLEPASHGCIRIPRPTSERFQSLLSMGDQVYVFDGVKQPEEYGEQLPVFNRIDPEWAATSTTSTTSTTTTAPPSTTTTAPAATPPPTTTTMAPATTAAAPPPQSSTTSPPPPPPPPPPTTSPPPPPPPSPTSPPPPPTTT